MQEHVIYCAGKGGTKELDSIGCTGKCCTEHIAQSNKVAQETLIHFTKLCRNTLQREMVYKKCCTGKYCTRSVAQEDAVR